MSARRTLVLALVCGALWVYLLATAEVPPVGDESSVLASPIVDCGGAAPTRLTLTTPGRSFVDARREDGTWTIEPEPASRWQAEAALEDVAQALCLLPVIERIDGADLSAFGLDDPRAVASIEVGGREVRVRLGASSPSGSFLYVTKDGDAKVLKVGALLRAEIDRLLFSGSSPVSP